VTGLTEPSHPLPPELEHARARLATLPTVEPAEQVATYEEIHRLLQDALAGLDAASGPDPAGA
jgi:hypothetical protein